MKELRKIRKEVFSLAHQIKATFATFGQALKAAWRIIKMKFGIATPITFAKSTGEIREAVALNCGSLSTIEKGFVRFLENIEGRTQWRSFRIERLIF